MIKVTMNLTEADVENADNIHELIHARSKAQAVSFALSLARFLLKVLIADPNRQLLIRNADGSLDGILIPELEGARSATGKKASKEAVAA